MFTLILSASAAEVFTYIGYVIVAVLALVFMIVIHETGHYLAGKLLGFKVDEFGIGFGPPIFKRTNKKTGEIFSIRPIPLGGFCNFHGEDEESENGKDADDKKKTESDKNPIFDDFDVKEDGTAAISTDKKGILDGVQNKDLGFNDHPAWKRLIVLFSGAFFNFLSAILIITIYFTAYGQILPQIRDISQTVGFEQVFEVGDIILSVDGKQVNIMEENDVSSAFSRAKDDAKFRVLRDGKVVTINAKRGLYQPFKEGDYITHIDGEKLAIAIPYTSLDSSPLIESKTNVKVHVVQFAQDGTTVISEHDSVIMKGINSDDADGWYSRGFGVTYSLVREKLDFFRAFGRAFGFCFFIVFKILASLGALITGKIGIESAGGTITVVKTIAEVSALGFDSFMYVVAIISANLAVMNLLPIPALDGSRMVFTLIEMIFRKPVPRKIEGVIHAVGLIILLLLVVFLDIFHLVSG